MRGPIAFIRDAFGEFEHVVWPTRRETKRYYKIVVVFIFVFTVFLFILSYIFGESIFFVRDIANRGGGTNVELPANSVPLTIDPENLDDDTIAIPLGDVSGSDGAETVIEPETQPEPETPSEDTSTDSV